MARKSDRERFDAKVEKSDGCWIWTAARTRDGYGSFWSGEYRNGVPGVPIMVLAHRWAFEHFVGSVPEGMNVCHSCDVPACVNPSHLFVGTQRDNVSDCISKGRHWKGRRSLTTAEAVNVRSRYRGEYGDLKRLAAEFNVSTKVIANIVRDLPRSGRLAA